jgi:nitroimidazol reductase NimA-like FMN-containing flavoprotein (pyridoxamine 5'-phosphate oxidase superfamily)
VGEREPITTLSEFSSANAVATSWSQGRALLADAEVYWVASVRPDGRPHVTPLLGVWFDGAMYFCTGANERKAKNLSHNAHCILTTGSNTLNGLDVVAEGDAESVGDEVERRRVADTYERKYGAHFTAPDGTWSGLGDSIRMGDVLLYRLVPKKVLGFAKGEPFSQTRWEFLADPADLAQA